MPVSTNPPSNAEVHVHGAIAAGGSNNRLTDFVFHFARGSLGPGLSKTAFDTAFQASIVVPLGLALNVRWLQSFNTVRWPDDATDAPVQFNHAVAGAVVGDSMPAHNAVYLLMRTGLRGRSFRGSKHFAPIAESATTLATDDILNAGALALFQTAAAAILAGFTDSNGNVWTPTILSRRLSQTRTNPTTIVANFVTQVIVNKRIGRMRKREVKSVY